MNPATIERLTAVMKERGITSEQLAVQLGVAASTVSDWLAGRHPNPASRLRALESTLGLEPTPADGKPGRAQLDPRIEQLIQLAKGFDDQVAGNNDNANMPDAGDEPSSDAPLHVVIQRAILKTRQSTGLTQAEIAARIGVSAPLLSQWVRGHRPIPDQHLLDLAKVLGLDFRRQLIHHFRGLAEEVPAEDRELATLIANLNQEAKAPLLRLLQRLKAK
jgi:transcriptional regulator with XRE-family HTH domain